MALTLIFFVCRRLLFFSASLFTASVAIFAMLRILPGDAAQIRLGTDATPEMVEIVREELGLNRSVLQQYLDWVGGLLHGDFGVSVTSGGAIGPEIRDKLLFTVPLLIASMSLAILLAVPLGVLAAVGHRRVYGALLSGISQVGIAIPAFWFGILLITFFSVNLQLLPSGGFPEAGWGEPVLALKSLVMPVVVLGVAQGVVLMRYVRSSVVDVMQEDFIRTARAKGLSSWQALRRHALRNAAVPVITVLGIQLANLLIGTVVIENVFGLPGLGRMLLQNVANRDLLPIQDIVLVLTGAVLLINLGVDVAYRLLDPRLNGAR